jgi:predicted SnoaL-like aldol condensation-catalyzing enzyme
MSNYALPDIGSVSMAKIDGLSIRCLLAEHWDVIQDEATAQESKSGRPMFGEQFL